MTTKFKVGETYKTRAGDTATIISTTRSHPFYTVVGFVKESGGIDHIQVWSETGKWNGSTDVHCPFDLVMHEERWINLYGLSAIRPWASRHNSLGAAEAVTRPAACARIKVTYTDGKPTSVELVCIPVEA